MKKNNTNLIIFIDILTEYKFITISNIKKYSKKYINKTCFKYKNIEISSNSHPEFKIDENIIKQI